MVRRLLLLCGQTAAAAAVFYKLVSSGGIHCVNKREGKYQELASIAGRRLGRRTKKEKTTRTKKKKSFRTFGAGLEGG